VELRLVLVVDTKVVVDVLGVCVVEDPVVLVDLEFGFVE